MSDLPAITLDDRRLRGVPEELRPGLVDVLAREPEHVPDEITLDRRGRPRPRFTLRQLVRPVRAGMALAVVLVALESVLVQVGPIMVQRAVDAGIVGGDFSAVVEAVGVYAAATLLGALTSSARISWTGRLGQRLLQDLRLRVFTKLQQLSQAYFTGERIGRLLTRMTSDIEALGQLLQDGLVNLLVQSFTLVAVTGFMFWLDPRLALIVLAVVIPPATGLTLWFRKASHRAYSVVRERLAMVLADLQENLAGARVIVATNRVNDNARQHADVARQHRDAQIASGNIQGAFTPSIEAAGRIGQSVVLAVGGAMVLDGSLTIGELTAFLLFLTAFFAPIQALVNLYNSYQSGQAAVGKIADLLEVPPTIVEREQPLELAHVRGHVRFDRVDFHYQPDQPVLRGVSLEILAGETVALVGTTGAGKSTLTKLLTRVYDPISGRVELDGIDVRELSLDCLRRAVGVVPQEPFLFAGTLRDNLTLGRSDLSDRRLQDTAVALGLGPLLDRLGGLDARLAERGSDLSAGERQLVALTRALVPRPQVLVLDEATSNLDLESEMLVDAALDHALRDRTAIVVAHRLSTAERADRVAVVSDGRIVEAGSHDELVARDRQYARLFARWTRTSVGR